MKTENSLRAVHRFGLSALIAFGATLAAVVTAAADTTETNFRGCLEGDTGCEPSLLTEEERRRVFEAAERRHLKSCLGGKRCNMRRLEPADRQRVETAVARLNLDLCLRGEGKCRYADLGVDELAQVIESDRRRNLDLCYSGVTACNERWLSEEERMEARRRYIDRNFNSCMETFGTLLPCNPQELTSDQRIRYRQRLLERNYFACLLGLIGCDLDRLTAEQRDQVMAERSDPVSGTGDDE